MLNVIIDLGVRQQTRPTPRSPPSTEFNSGFSFHLKPCKLRLRGQRRNLATIERPTSHGLRRRPPRQSEKNFLAAVMTVSELFWPENSFDYDAKPVSFVVIFILQVELIQHLKLANG